MQRLLIIDDNPAALQAYSDLLAAREPAIQVTTAISAEAALESMDATVFDVVVCDFGCPAWTDSVSYGRATRPVVILPSSW